MTAADLELFKLVDGPIIGTDHKNRMDAVIRHFHAQGRTLAECCDERRLARGMSALKAYARRLKLDFPDYMPRSAVNHVSGMYYLAGSGPARRYCRECASCGEAPPARKGGQPVQGACLKMLAVMRKASLAQSIGQQRACKYFEERAPTIEPTP